MKIVISPAKSLDFESPLPTQQHTGALFLKQANTIQKVLQKKKPKQLHLPFLLEITHLMMSQRKLSSVIQVDTQNQIQPLLS